MNHLKITQPGFETYTGYLGIIEFDNGMSTEPVPRRHADQLSASIIMVEVDEYGEEAQAGPAARLVGGATIPADILEPLARQTDAEKAAEKGRVSVTTEKVQEAKICTLDELEAIASKDGIQGLRPIGKAWGVRDRSIPGLIGAILEAQREFLQNNAGERLVSAAAAAEMAAPVGTGIEKPPAETPAPADPQSVLVPEENMQ